MDQVVAQVGQYSREAGRVPVHVLHERLEDERAKLVGELKSVEASLSDLASAKADKLANIYRRRMHRSDAIAATNEIQAAFNESRSQFIRDKAAIEERMHDIKRQLSSTADVREDVKVLLRIESLLERVVSKLSST